MAHASMDYQMDFISLLSLSNIGVIEPELAWAQEHAAAPAALSSTCTAAGFQDGTSGREPVNGYQLPINGLNTNCNGLDRSIKRRRGQLEAEAERATNLVENGEDWTCPTKV